MQKPTKQPIVLCGLGRMGARVLEYLRAARLPVVVVDNECQPDDERLGGGNVRLVQGDCRKREVLVEAGVREAQGVLVLTSDDLVNITTTLAVRSLNPGVRIVLRMFDQNLIGRLGHALHNVYALSTAMLTAPILAMTVMTGQAIGAFRIERHLPGNGLPVGGAGLADRGKANRDEPAKGEGAAPVDSVGYLVAEVRVEPGSDLHGRSIEELIAYPDVVVVGHLTGPAAAGTATVSWRRTMLGLPPEEQSGTLGEGGAPAHPIRLVNELDPKARLKAGDVIILCGEPRALSPLLKKAEEESVPNLLWAPWLRRWGRVAWRSLSEIDRPMLLATGVLIAVLIISTLVLHFGSKKYTLADSLFHTVRVMATMTGMPPGEDFEEREYMEAYIAGLRLVGATLLAVFTAIVTNYLLRARMSGALEVRRIPDRGHIVVCGLGSIGYLVVEELLRYDERVVVIERDLANRFVTTARRLGVPVIAGDAGVYEVMRQAHAGQAAAVIATTSNDLTNLAVALQAREANPTQRVVLLMNDPELARMLREGADVELAVSVPKLAAPAFLAGMFGDRVQTVFMVRHHLLTVIDLVLQAADPLEGRSLRAVGIDYNLRPITVFHTGGAHLAGTTGAWEPVARGKRLFPAQEGRPAQAVRLSRGDRLVAVVPLTDLERLLHRQPPPACCAVEIGGFPLQVREWMVGVVQEVQKVSVAEAECIVEQLPFRLADRVTRGEAADLIERLVAERVTAYLTPDTDAKVGE
jgi:Trk K+ transport system NAD-binding subunit